MLELAEVLNVKQTILYCVGASCTQTDMVTPDPVRTSSEPRMVDKLEQDSKAMKPRSDTQVPEHSNNSTVTFTRHEMTISYREGPEPYAESLPKPLSREF